MAKVENEAYLFDISKADQIFDCLVQIKFPECHKIPLVEEIKGKKYCKRHHSWNHTINNYNMFRKCHSESIKRRQLKLAKKRDMIVDTNPFGMSINMVSISTTRKGQRNGKIPR